jgi:hypothetical protein
MHQFSLFRKVILVSIIFVIPMQNIIYDFTQQSEFSKIIELIMSITNEQCAKLTVPSRFLTAIMIHKMRKHTSGPSSEKPTNLLTYH